MKLYEFLPICSMFLFAACSNESTSGANDEESENLTSSETVEESSSSLSESSSSWIASNSSSSRNDVDASSSSKNKNASSSSHNDVQSSSSNVIPGLTGNLSSSSSNQSSVATESSSSAESPESSSSEILTDPLEIFETRIPNQKAIHCKIEESYTSFEKDVAERDLICSFKYNDEEGFVYVQSNPTKCIGSNLNPHYEVHKAEFYVNGSMKEISNVRYYGGGDHGIYGIDFTYNGKVFKYGYSTMGMGGRPCQNVDCMQVYEADGKTVVEDGCTEERTLPIVCRPADEDGDFGSFEDTYHVCKNDWDIPI